MGEDNDAGSGCEASMDNDADHMGGGCCGEGSAEDHHEGAGTGMETDSEGDTGSGEGEGRVEDKGRAESSGAEELVAEYSKEVVDKNIKENKREQGEGRV